MSLVFIEQRPSQNPPSANYLQQHAHMRYPWQPHSPLLPMKLIRQNTKINLADIRDGKFNRSVIGCVFWWESCDYKATQLNLAHRERPSSSSIASPLQYSLSKLQPPQDSVYHSATEELPCCHLFPVSPDVIQSYSEQ